MKINGRVISGPRVETIVIPRQEGDLVFRAQCVLDYEPFDKLCPQPKPPQRMLPGGATSYNTDSPQYQEQLNEWATSKWHWMVLKSLEATEGLEWDTVKMDDPSTFKNFYDDFEAASLAPNEIQRIVMTVTNACGLNQSKIDEATKAFLAGQGRAQEEQSSPSSEPNATPNGEPVSASA